MLLALLAQIALAVPAVAVADLSNHTGQARFDAAGPGTASMIVTKLAQIDDMRVVERTQLQQVLKEIELSKGGAVDDATRVEAGRLIGADFIVMGTLFTVETGVLTVNMRIVDTETGEVIRAADVSGAIGADGSGYFELVNRLVEEVLDGLAIELSEAEKIAVTSVRMREIEALLKYGAVGADQPVPAARSQALWRDRSRDMMGDSERLRYGVFTNGGARIVTVRQFATLVGDETTLASLQGVAETPPKKNKGLARIGLVSLVVGGALIPGALLADREDRVPVLLGAAGLGLAGSTMVLLGNTRGGGPDAGRLPVGRGYTPEEADQWIDSYNRSLSEASSP